MTFANRNEMRLKEMETLDYFFCNYVPGLNDQSSLLSDALQ
jgi:hypothetical protein